MAKKEDIDTLIADLHTLDSKIGLIAQRIRTIEQNQEVIGRTLITLNNRFRELEEKNADTPVKNQGGNLSEMETKFATKQEIKELKYTLDMINPLDFATLQQVRNLLDEKLAKLSLTSATEKKEVKEIKKPDNNSNLMQSI